MGNQDQIENQLSSKQAKTIKFIVFTFLGIIFTKMVFIQLKNEIYYSKYGIISGEVVGKKIDLDKKNSYEIIIESEITNLTFEIHNEDVFYMIEPGNFFIKRGNGDTCLLVIKKDTIPFDPLYGIIYSRPIPHQ